MKFTRRNILKGSLATVVAGLTAPVIRMAYAGSPEFSPGYDYVLVAEMSPVEFIKGKTTQAWLFDQQFPAPILRVKQGERLRVKLINRLEQMTSIHWHGIRIDNAMDGVPHLTQPPVLPGESFVYDFVCPDAGTFWYHPHTHSIEQMGKGLMGCLIVEEKEKPAFDAEHVLVLKDWCIDNEGQWTEFTNHRNAARMGTLGAFKTVNGLAEPTYTIPAGAAVRLRIANVDSTRLYRISLKDFPAQVIAEEGNALEKPYVLSDRPTGPGMRVDIALLAPEKAGEEVVLYDKRGDWYFALCRFRTVPNSKTVRTTLPLLPRHHIPEPDLANAEQLNFVFEWEGALTPANADGQTDAVFWTINRRAWTGEDHQTLPEPLARMTLNKTYIINMYNASPHHHPIHMHGHTFKVLKSDKRAITPYFTDTILLEKTEHAQVAFVADNPGKWMFHCHVIEHMMTGLMGYIEVV